MDAILLNIFLSLLFGFILYKYNKNKKDTIIIWGLYMVSAVSARFYDPSTLPGFGEQESYNNWYCVLYGILIIYALSPLLVLANTKKPVPLLESVVISKKLKTIIFWAGIGGVYSFLYQLPFAIISITKGASYIRSEVLAKADESVLPENIFTTIAVAFSTFFPLFLVFLFICYKQKFPNKYKVLMLFGSLSYVMTSFCFTARDGIVFYMIFVIIILANFWGNVPAKMKKKILVILSLAFAVGAWTIFSFTSSRFGDSNERLKTGTVGYIAQQPYVFVENINRRHVSTDFYGIGFRFPLVATLIGRKTTEKVVRTEPYEWTFGSFLTDFFNISGFTSLFVLLIGSTEFFKFQFKRIRKKTPLKFLILYILYVHLIVSGLFYFRLGNSSGNIYLLIMLILFFAVSTKKVITITA